MIWVHFLLSLLRKICKYNQRGKQVSLPNLFIIIFYTTEPCCSNFERRKAGSTGGVVEKGEAGTVETELEMIIEYFIITPTGSVSDQMIPSRETPTQIVSDDPALE